jgi:hypothetical protein
MDRWARSQRRVRAVGSRPGGSAAPGGAGRSSGRSCRRARGRSAATAGCRPFGERAAAGAAHLGRDPAGTALRGTSCPTGNPTASLDGQQLNLNVDRSATGKGFKATATIPASVNPGKHSPWAGCDAGSAAPGPGEGPAGRRQAGVRPPAAEWPGPVVRPVLGHRRAGGQRRHHHPGAAPDPTRLTEARPRGEAGPGLLLATTAPARR